MKIGVPKEIHAGEKRVATTPEVVEKLLKLGFAVTVESNAGAEANFSDDAYREAGASITDRAGVWDSDIIFKVRAPEVHPELAIDEVESLREGSTLVSFIWPGQNPELMERMAAKKVTVLAMDSVPRVSRAQKLDALSSMANIAGYRAVVEAAHAFGRFFCGQITAAGKVPPAKVFIVGVGVAGLAAIGAASGLGAIVRASDTRPEVKDQVKSMGAEFVDVDYQEEGTGVGGYAKVMSEGYQKAQREMYARQAMDVDIIITTALIPGKPAPRLISAGMVESMKPGSVIVDMAAEQGGNCELSVAGEIVVHHGVTIIGYTDLPSRLAKQSSQLYGTNLWRLSEELCKNKDGVIDVNMEDEVIRGATVIKEGAITWPPPPPKISAAPTQPAAAAAVAEPKKAGFKLPACVTTTLQLGVAAAALIGLGMVAPPAFMSHFTVFVLACFVGYMVIWNVTPALHTPLMSVTNAISGIIVIGALLQIAPPEYTGNLTGNIADLITGHDGHAHTIISKIIPLFAGLAILVATINVVGGFWVTQRMLKMFRR
ncbi:MAG: Re/Si-specific NAD(P)(+) transhydrogenase subunit alpha [Methylococcaceae bacterium]|nr:MAG: Re/Si-specific NAD(P)(+) transhydrogenase subunit alpha [Methylococcaceae bacterium]